MSDRVAWDARYREPGLRHGGEPAAFLRQNLHRLKPGRALDVAMGEGQNAVFLAEHGFQVVGVDFSEIAVRKAQQLARARGVCLDLCVADLERWWLPTAAFDLVINFRYLQRSLVPMIQAALRPGGFVVFQTHTLDQLAFENGPRNPAHLLKRNELRELFGDFQILVYDEGVRECEPGKLMAMASLVARKPGDKNISKHPPAGSETCGRVGSEVTFEIVSKC